jgi:hypothetical protein
MNIHRPRLGTIGAFLLLAAPTTAQNVGVAFSNLVDGYIEIPYTPQVVPQSGITVEAWITYDDATLPTGWRYPTLVRQGLSVGGSEDYFLRINADNVGARVLRWKVVTSNNTAVTVNWTFAAGQLNSWTHVAATYDGAFARLYVNGAPAGQATGNGLPIRDAGSEVLRIGKGSDVATPIEVWNGQIDEVRLWPFARTQAEIQATMNQALYAVPGRVSTWNLDGHTFDTSSTLHATLVGGVTYTQNPLVLDAPLLPSPHGASTPGCLGALELAPTSAASAGNLVFGIACTRTAANAPALWAASLGTVPTPVLIEGVDVWIDFNGLVVANATTSGLGALRFTLALPATAPIGFPFAMQAAVVDPCGPLGFTASNAVIIVVQP